MFFIFVLNDLSIVIIIFTIIDNIYIYIKNKYMHILHIDIVGFSTGTGSEIHHGLKAEVV